MRFGFPGNKAWGGGGLILPSSPAAGCWTGAPEDSSGGMIGEDLLGLEEPGAHLRQLVPPGPSRQRREPTLLQSWKTEATTDATTLRFAWVPRQEFNVRYQCFHHFPISQRTKLSLRTALEILEHPGHYFPPCVVRLLRCGPSFSFKAALCEKGRDGGVRSWWVRGGGTGESGGSVRIKRV